VKTARAYSQRFLAIYLCRLVDRYQRFGGLFCHHLQGVFNSSWINSKMEAASSYEMLVPVYLLRKQHHYGKLRHYIFTVLISDPESCTMPYIAFVIYCSVSHGKLKWS